MTQNLHNVSKGQSSSAAKMKSLMGAMEIMTETQHAFQLIYNELLEEQVKRYTVYIYNFWIATLLGLVMLSRMCSYVCRDHTLLTDKGISPH